MYLDKGDYGYKTHYVEMPVMNEGKDYPGKRDENGWPVDMDELNKWTATLPKAWQNNPFHNHFIYIEPDTTDEEIMEIAEAFLHEAYVKWASDEKLDLDNTGLPFSRCNHSEDIVQERLGRLKTTELKRHIK